MGIKNIFEKLTGIDKVKEQAAAEAAEFMEIANQAKKAAEDAKKIKDEIEESTKKAVEEEKLAKLSPKERATKKRQPWVGVLDTHVNKENIRNGFFELDWNKYFIEQLISEGYGLENDPQEEIVDRWFRELCANVVVDGDFGGPLDAGSIKSKLSEK